MSAAKPLKGRSQALTGPVDEVDGKAHADRSAARAMLRATGWKKEDFRKPIIVVAVTHTNATPCNDHHREMGDIVAARITELGGMPFIFGTPVVSDGEVGCHAAARLPPALAPPAPRCASAHLRRCPHNAQTTGTYGMNYSLVSRDLIADCIETMHLLRDSSCRVSRIPCSS
jgi:dihydroxyacid dehydratase/phosphogluconate dehydratase